jgi:tetratricopeptide (TPR) repeat protein
MGRLEESIEIGRQTLELDPLSPAAYSELAWPHWFAGHDDEALEITREGLEIDPEFWMNNWHLHLWLSERYIKTGDFDKASANLAQLDRVRQTPSSSHMGLIGRTYALAGQQTEARSIISQLMERRAQGYVPASALANIHIGLGEYDEALKWLEAAYEERDVYLVWLKEMWIYDRLRSDPRFQDILNRMNFPVP